MVRSKEAGGKEARRQGDTEAGRHGGKEPGGKEAGGKEAGGKGAGGKGNHREIPPLCPA